MTHPQSSVNASNPLDREIMIAGANTAESKQWKNKTMTLRQLGVVLAQCKFGKKDGLCFLPGALKEDGRRGSSLMIRIELLPYDLDTGRPIESILMQLHRARVTAWAYATHSHMREETAVSGGVVERWAKLSSDARAPDEQVLAWLRTVKGYAPAVLDGAVVTRSQGSFDAVVKHKPMPRYRLIIPLARPLYMPKLGNTPVAAERAYKALYRIVAGILGIEHYDRSCEDPARVSYLHRRPDGAEPWFVAIDGRPLDPAPFIEAAKEHSAASPGKPQQSEADLLDAVVRFFGNKQDGDSFRAADFVAAYASGAQDNGKKGIEAICPFQDRHTSGPDDRRTLYAYNPDAGKNGHPVIGCNHTGCSDDKLTLYVVELLQRAGEGAGALDRFADATATPASRDDSWSHDALAMQFAARHESDLRYVHVWNRWLLWNGAGWQEEQTLKAFDFARQVARQAAAGHKAAKEIRSSMTTAAIVTLARSDRKIAAALDIWDKDPMLLCTPAGTVDLRTGQLRPARREDYLTKMTATGPGNGGCPLWLQTLDQVFAGDRELIDYVQRVCGYCLTGRTDEHALFFAHGPGGNGKTTLIGTLRAILGGYGQVTVKGQLEESRHEGHRTSLADLRGARVVVASETQGGARWNETLVKTLTGGDPVKANFMRQDNFTYMPEFKLIVLGNYKPSLRSVNDAMRRRLHLIPFNVKFDGANRVLGMEDRLRAEWPGILRWAIEGCLMWQERGLAKPAAVRQATATYFDEEDAVGGFLADCCTRDDPNAMEEQGDLFERYKTWCRQNGKAVQVQREFAKELAGRGLQPGYHPNPKNRRAVFRGIKLQSPQTFFD
jgi:putative DNA primase/helicase